MNLLVQLVGRLQQMFFLRVGFSGEGNWYLFTVLLVDALRKLSGNI
jgi:hypothetical protein